jgi:signal transduction histidine kinase
MQNLIVNAIKFMGSQPHPIINIGFENIDDEQIFFVQDNGIGIGSEYHESIFELFKKLDPATEGTGLGLGLVKRIIEVHNGRLWVESEPGKGATFKFTLQ